MKTHLEPGLFFVGGHRSPSDVAALLGIGNPAAVTGAPDGSQVEFVISEGSDDHEAVLSDLVAWIGKKTEELKSVGAEASVLVLKHYIPQNHGYSCVVIPETLSRLAADLGFRICVTNVTLFEQQPAAEQIQATRRRCQG